MLFLLLASLVVLYFVTDLDQKLSFAELKANQADLQAIYQLRPGWMILVYSAAYILMAALSLPGATILSMAGGAIFGLWTAVALVSFSSTIGATLAFLSARFVFGDFIERRWSARLQIMHRGLEKDGWRYVLTLRLAPLFPFFLVNLALGLTRLPIWTFFWVSLVGMFPGTVLYVNAGTSLGNLRSPEDVMTAGFLLSFFALGIFPWLALRVQKKWK